MSCGVRHGVHRPRVRGELQMAQPQGHRRCQGDQGAAMIEGAIVALPFFILLFGIVEFGITFKAYLSLTAATNTSARAASTFGSDTGSDYFILRRINESGSGLGRTNINHIVIWHASGPDDTPPAACLDGDGSGGTGGAAKTDACNVYTPYDFAYVEADFDCNSGNGGPPDSNWCPTARKDFLADTDSTGPLVYGTDYIGVYVDID